MTAFDGGSQIQLPDVFGSAMSNMRGIGASVLEGADQMGNLIVEALGDLLGKAVNKTINFAAGAAAATTGAIASAGRAVSAPFDSQHFLPSATLVVAQGHSIEAPSRGLSHEVSAPSYGVSCAELGTLSPNAGLPMRVHAMGGHSRSMC